MMIPHAPISVTFALQPARKPEEKPGPQAPGVAPSANAVLRITASRPLPARALLLLLLATNLLAAAARASEPLANWARQVELANRMLESGEFELASAHYATALADARAAGDGLRAAVVLHNLGKLFALRGQLREAATAYKCAIQEFQSAGADYEKSLVRSYLGLATVYIQTGEYSKARRLVQSVLAGNPSAAEADRASLMGVLGVILGREKRFAEAEAVLRETAGMCEKAADAETREAGAVALANLAGLQMRTGRAPEAVVNYRRAVEIMEALPAPSPATLALTLADYASAEAALGDGDAAEKLCEDAMTVARARLGPDHHVLARVLEARAEVLRQKGRKPEARKLRNEARRIRAEWARRNMTGLTVEVHALAEKKR